MRSVRVLNFPLYSSGGQRLLRPHCLSLSRDFFSAKPSSPSSPSSSSSSSLKRHHERKLVRFPMQTMYSVVADVAQYKHFVPWCRDSLIVNHVNDRSLEAELVVGFQLINERYTSRVTLEPCTRVVADSSNTSVFETLTTEWRFSPASDSHHCWVQFKVDFQFRSALYNELSELFMQEVAKKMMHAFETRCKVVHEQNKTLPGAPK